MSTHDIKTYDEKLDDQILANEDPNEPVKNFF